MMSHISNEQLTEGARESSESAIILLFKILRLYLMHGEMVLRMDSGWIFMKF